MQMRPRDVTRSAAFGYYLTFVNTASAADGYSAQMRVIGHVPVIVLYSDKITVSAEPPCVYHLAAVRGIDVGPACGTKVYT